jgi:hypothetical protein
MSGEGTALGCIGRCRVCGKAIQLRRAVAEFSYGLVDLDEWVHFAEANHRAFLSPGVLDVSPCGDCGRVRQLDRDSGWCQECLWGPPPAGLGTGGTQ